MVSPSPCRVVPEPCNSPLNPTLIDPQARKLLQLEHEVPPTLPMILTDALGCALAGYPGVDLNPQLHPATQYNQQGIPPYHHQMDARLSPSLPGSLSMPLPVGASAPQFSGGVLFETGPAGFGGGPPHSSSSLPTTLPPPSEAPQKPPQPFWVHPAMLDSAQDSLLRPSLA